MGDVIEFRSRSSRPAEPLTAGHDNLIEVVEQLRTVTERHNLKLSPLEGHALKIVRQWALGQPTDVMPYQGPVIPTEPLVPGHGALDEAAQHTGSSLTPLSESGHAPDARTLGRVPRGMRSAASLVDRITEIAIDQPKGEFELVREAIEALNAWTTPARLAELGIAQHSGPTFGSL